MTRVALFVSMMSFLACHGQQGAQGPAGEQGPTGEQGPAGERGEVGPAGEQGPKGSTGEAGAPGAKGDKGDPGDPGEAGAKGDTGEAGAKGDPGVAGAKGDTGAAGAKGDTGAAGAKGDKGDPGAPGAAGLPGADGADGAPGAAGAKGDKGDKGEQGDKGEDGVQGIAGEPGAKGDKGDQGATGAKGDKGDAGATGAKGDKGDPGATGAKGDKGDPGVVSAAAPLALNGTALSIATAANGQSGVLAASDWALFNAKVSSTDSRLSDARAPTAGSGNYLQNQSAAHQEASFDIGGNGYIGGKLTIAGDLAVSGTITGTLSATAVSAPLFRGSIVDDIRQGLVFDTSNGLDGVVLGGMQFVRLLSTGHMVMDFAADSNVGRVDASRVSQLFTQGRGASFGAWFRTYDTRSQTIFIFYYCSAHTLGLNIDSAGYAVGNWDSTGQRPGIIYSQAPVNDGKWHHVVYVFDQPHHTSQLYLDGVLQGEVANPSEGIDFNQTTMRIAYFNGDCPGQPLTYYRGQMDALRYWTRPLSASEIAAYVQATKTLYGD